MSEGRQIIALEASSLATALPNSMMHLVSDLIDSCDLSNWPSERHRITNGIAHAHYRSLVGKFLDAWKSQAADVSPEAVAIAIYTAAQCESVHHDGQSVELAWTGPVVGAVSFRRTEQAILQVLDFAEKRITLVSYAVYRIPNVCGALTRAARRGVQISVIVETPDKVKGEDEYNTLQALGQDVAACSTVYYWPRQQREQTDAGKLAILHVKCAVADGRWLFLSSANLTEYAFTINMELGVLVTGGELPRQVEDNFDRLIGLGVLERV